VKGVKDVKMSWSDRRAPFFTRMLMRDRSAAGCLASYAYHADRDG